MCNDHRPKNIYRRTFEGTDGKLEIDVNETDCFLFVHHDRLSIDTEKKRYTISIQITEQG